MDSRLIAFIFRNENATSSKWNCTNEKQSKWLHHTQIILLNPQPISNMVTKAFKILSACLSKLRSVVHHTSEWWTWCAESRPVYSTIVQLLTTMWHWVMSPSYRKKWWLQCNMQQQKWVDCFRSTMIPMQPTSATGMQNYTEISMPLFN